MSTIPLCCCLALTSLQQSGADPLWPHIPGVVDLELTRVAGAQGGTLPAHAQKYFEVMWTISVAGCALTKRGSRRNHSASLPLLAIQSERRLPGSQTMDPVRKVST